MYINSVRIIIPEFTASERLECVLSTPISCTINLLLKSDQHKNTIIIVEVPSKRILIVMKI